MVVVTVVTTVSCPTREVMNIEDIDNSNFTSQQLPGIRHWEGGSKYWAGCIKYWVGDIKYWASDTTY